VLHYQPIVDAHTGRVAGAEALLRWEHPERGLVTSGEFIAVAEQAGLIELLGTWSLREAVRQAADWRAQGVGDGEVCSR
jgi:EAL domain-containing protein (putative c-di-GMP-specific phosphodiesterase class I)